MQNNEQYGRKYGSYRNNIYCQVQGVISQNGFHSVNFELSRRENGATVHAGKYAIQVSQLELPRVCAFFLGYIDYAAGKYHGDSNNKYELKRSGQDIELSITCDSRRYINLSIDDRFYFSGICIGQLAKNLDLTEAGIAALLRNTFAVNQKPNVVSIA